MLHLIYLLNGCSHCGNVVEAQSIWNNEIKDEEIKYNCYVVTCLVDCLSRNGLNGVAYDLYLEYKKYHHYNSDENDEILLVSLLNGCKRYNNMDLAEILYKEINHWTA